LVERLKMGKKIPVFKANRFSIFPYPHIASILFLIDITKKAGQNDPAASQANITT
jgi:hypothetical protein